MNTSAIFRKIPLRMMLCTAFMMPISSIHAQAPDTVFLLDCHRSAMETHPMRGQQELYLQTRDLNLQNHSLGWYPSLDLNGKYTWQNEVVEIPFPDVIPGFEIPSMPHSNYTLTLDIQQTVYDGGISRRARGLEETLYAVRRQQVEVNLNQLKEQVNQVYFLILVLQEREKTIRLKLEELKERLGVMESRFRNEVILASDLNVLKAEILKVEQQLAELSTSRRSALVILEELTSLKLSDQTVLTYPAGEVESLAGSELPEQVLFDLQIRNLDASMRLTERQRYPKAFVFGQLGYGNPALNFFRDEFRGYYIVGAGLQWKIWDWSKTRRDKQVLSIQQEIIRTQKETFDKNLNIRLEELQSEIIKYREAVSRDREILSLRKEITLAASSKLENGVITSTEYLTELNAEIQARIQLDLHRIQLDQARIAYLTGKGII